MKSLVDELVYVKGHLSNKERWETNKKNNKITGYSSGSLMNTLGGIWNNQDQRNYVAAYDCVQRAILDLMPNLDLAGAIRIIPGDSDPVNIQHYHIVRVFSEHNSHEELMVVLDRAIRYAKLYAFS